MLAQRRGKGWPPRLDYHLGSLQRVPFHWMTFCPTMFKWRYVAASSDLAQPCPAPDIDWLAVVQPGKGHLTARLVSTSANLSFQSSFTSTAPSSSLGTQTSARLAIECYVWKLHEAHEPQTRDQRSVSPTRSSNTSGQVSQSAWSEDLPARSWPHITCEMFPYLVSPRATSLCQTCPHL